MSWTEVSLALLVVLLLVMGGLGALGAWVAIQKGRDRYEGFTLGLLFGPLGVIVEGLLPVRGTTPMMPYATSVPQVDQKAAPPEGQRVAVLLGHYRIAIGPGWSAMTYKEKRAVLSHVERRVASDWGMDPKLFALVADQARRQVL